MSSFLYILFFAAVVLIFIKLWIKLTAGVCESNVCLVDKTAIITGGNTGIGYATATDFAKRGAKVILACRNQIKGEDAQRKLIEETNNPNIHYRQLDLASFRSVREFAAEINKSEERLDILVNNAGVSTTDPLFSEDGLLLLMQTNYFGPFLLTNLLLDLLKRTQNSRIVNVASHIAKYASPLDLDKLNQPTSTGWWEFLAYAKSKLCIILFTVELAKRLRDTSTTVYSLNPGAVCTEVSTQAPLTMKYSVQNILKYFYKTSREGAQTVIYCSVQKDIEPLSGENFDDCLVVEKYPAAQDYHLSSKLWDVSKKLVNLNQSLV